MQILTEKPAYPITALMSDVGGSLGLYIGMPLLGIVEIIHFLILFLYSTCYKAKAAVMK